MDFQDRSTNMATTVSLASGQDKIGSMYGSIPYFEHYWEQH